MLFSCGGSRTTPRAARTTLVVSRSMSRPVWEREIHSERLRLRERPQVRAGGQRRKYATADARRRDATPDSRSLVSRATASIRTSITTRRTRALTGKDQLQERSEEERRDGRGGGTQTRRDNSKIWRPLTGAGLREGEELAHNEQSDRERQRCAVATCQIVTVSDTFRCLGDTFRICWNRF